MASLLHCKRWCLTLLSDEVRSIQLNERCVKVSLLGVISLVPCQHSDFGTWCDLSRVGRHLTLQQFSHELQVTGFIFELRALPWSLRFVSEMECVECNLAHVIVCFKRKRGSLLVYLVVNLAEEPSEINARASMFCCELPGSSHFSDDSRMDRPLWSELHEDSFVVIHGTDPSQGQEGLPAGPLGMLEESE